MPVKRWIILADTEDARRKQLVLAKAALTHFGKISRLMVQTVKKLELVWPLKMGGLPNDESQARTSVDW
jgi:hypothetical protein